MPTEAEIQDHNATYYDRRYTGLGREYHQRILQGTATEGGLMGHAIGRILDAGCGTGFVSALAQESGVPADITGVDISDGMLAKHPGTYLKADVTALPFPNDHFHFILCRSLLHHLPDPAAGLAELHRVLVPGGRIACWETNQSVVAALVRKVTQHGDRFSAFHQSFSRRRLLGLIGRWFEVETVTHQGYLAYPLFGFPDILPFERWLPFPSALFELTWTLDTWLSTVPGLRRGSWALRVIAKKPGVFQHPVFPLDSAGKVATASRASTP